MVRAANWLLPFAVCRWCLPGPCREGPGPHEVWANPTTLLTLDGRVLEVFGFADAQRFHLAFRPVLQRSAKLLTIKPEHGPKLSFFYDRENAERLDAFARLLEAAHPAR